jgi:hypothetical protein
VFGKQDTDPIELSAITAGKGGFIINDESGRNFSGCLVSSAGDVNWHAAAHDIKVVTHTH